LEAARQIEQITIPTLTFKEILQKLQPYQISVILSSVCADFPDVKTPKKRAADDETDEDIQWGDDEEWENSETCTCKLCVQVRDINEKRRVATRR
jgi:hypothetical protein